MNQIQYDIAELKRKLANIIKVGVIAAVDHGKARVRVNLGTTQSAWLPWLTTRAGGDVSWWAPEEGEKVLILSPGGALEFAWVLPSIFTTEHGSSGSSADRHLVEYKDGTTMSYDRGAHALNVHLPSGGKVRVVAEGGIKLEGNTTIVGSLTVGDIHADGTIRASGDVADKKATMSKDRGIFNRHTHIGYRGQKTTSPIEKM